MIYTERGRIMKKSICFIVCGLFLFGIVGTGLADDSASHTVTVNVSAIDDVTLTGGNVTLSITALNTATTDDSSSLAWVTNQTTRRITVASNINSVYGLTVSPADFTGAGTAAGSAVTVGTTAQNLVTAISTGSGSCTLQYSATAEPTDGTASEVHTVTYTITAT
jgi:hypothetical protein